MTGNWFQSSLSDIYSHFESIGNNCEFGIVQRRIGYDPPGLFRNVGYQLTDQIINALDAGLEPMFEEGSFSFTLREGWPDWTLHCKRFGFSFHSAIPSAVIQGGEEWEARERKCLGAFRLMKRKFQEDLASGEKIFVFRRKENAPSGDIDRLLKAIRKHGAGWILNTREDLSQPAGSVELVRPGLLSGYVGRLSNENPPNIEFDSWERISRNALAIRLGARGIPALWHHKHSTVRGIANTSTPLAGMDVLEHRISPHLRAEPVFYYVLDDAIPGAIYRAGLWVCIGRNFDGTEIGAAMLGYPSRAFRTADLKQRDEWQRLWVEAAVPPEGRMLVPSLLASGQGTLLTGGWEIECLRSPVAAGVSSVKPILSEPTDSRAECPPHGNAQALASDTRQLTVASLDSLLVGQDTSAGVQYRDVDAGLTVDLSFRGFGQKTPPSMESQEPDHFDLRDYTVNAPRVFLLDDIDLHARFGLFGMNGVAVRESLGHFPWWMFPELKVDGDLKNKASITIPNREPAAHILVGYSAHDGLHTNYYHWTVLILARINRQLMKCWSDVTKAAPVVLYPSFVDSVQKEAADCLAERYGVPYVAVDKGLPLRVSKLIYPHFRSDGVHPHPMIREPFDELRSGFYDSGSGYPEKIYLSRRDSPNRRLVNEDAVEELLRKHGYQAVTLTGRPLKEQINILAHARKVIAPHGAGSANMVYCQQGTRFLEIQMPSHANWCFRRLAAALGVEYGFVFGRLTTDSERYVQNRNYVLDLAVLDEALQSGF